MKKPELKDFELNDKMISFYQKINSNKEKTNILSFNLSLGFVITLFIWAVIGSKNHDFLYFRESRYIGLIFLIYWCSICAVFGLGLIPIISIILEPFLFIHDKVYSNILAPPRKRKMAMKIQDRHNDYLRMLSDYNWLIESEKIKKEKLNDEQRKIEIERIRAESLKNEEYWMTMTGYTFEKEVANIFVKMGYDVNLTSKTNDKGIDIILKTDSEKIIVQCKNHKSPVGPSIIRELYGVMISENADKAILVCSGGFTSGVYSFAKSKPIELISLKELIKLQQTI